MRFSGLTTLALLAGLLLSPSVVWAGPANIKAILSNPEQYAGQGVTLRGVIDQCTRVSCHLCEEKADDGKRACLTLGRWAAAASANSDLKAEEAWRTLPPLDQIYRFSTVRLKGRLQYKDPARKDADLEEQMKLEEEAAERGLAIDFFGCRPSRDCIQYGEAWIEAPAVTEVLGRTSPLQGVLSGVFDTPLDPAPLPDFLGMAAALPEIYTERANLTGSDPYGPRGFTSKEYDGGWICIQAENEYGLTRDWPTKLGHLLTTPVDRYRCFHLRNDRGTWRRDVYDSPD